ncbi:MAG: carbamoyltransferase HypF [Bryobacteraceae bacterium]|nr:carbamoyltransferase HypF [Bryobacteraceae bacterium]
MTAAVTRKRIAISGIVQGVGFRPFVYRLAQELRLGGYVLNTSEGVLVEAEGHPEALERFLEGLRRRHPPFARIEEMIVTDAPPAGETEFAIRSSEETARPFVLVSPDLATCEDCYRDFTDPGNRRFRYPFTNCTHCGPRYTIIRDIPYDRPLTTMARFQMCSACQAEYDDPADRRFHAQPNACPRCGPRLTLLWEGRVFDSEAGDSEPVLRQAQRLLAEGHILAVKGLGGFHLACDAENDAAVRRLRERKRRSDKPFAVMAPDLATVAQFCWVAEADRAVLLSVERPIVILPRRPEAAISPAVAPFNNTLGVMLPYTPLHHLLLLDAPYRLLVMTSGNVSEEPIVTSNEEALVRLSGIADVFLLHDRDIYMRVDDSVVRTFEGRPRLVRRSRGYAPHPIELGAGLEEVLACGAELKNTFCLTKGRYALLSQHIGDLENYETLAFFAETLERMKKLFRVAPRVVAYDLHPDYLTTRFARELDVPLKVGVQHHHAHIAACMAENGLRDKVIGVAFDGTGYGTDGQIWGGEFLVADLAGFERRACFRYVPLPGGDQAVRQPWRSAVSYLTETFGSFRDWPELPLLEAVPPKTLELVQTMIRRRVNTVGTSSCGRLFDAVASILGLRHEVTFEGQAAIELEMTACEGVEESYFYDLETDGLWRLDLRATIRAIVADRRRGVSSGVIAAKFHNTVAAAIVEVSRRLRQAERLNRVCLSGGTFQNMYLLRRAVAGLRRSGFEVFLHSQVPANDGGLSLGQAAVASQISGFRTRR